MAGQWPQVRHLLCHIGQLEVRAQANTSHGIVHNLQKFEHSSYCCTSTILHLSPYCFPGGLSWVQLRYTMILLSHRASIWQTWHMRCSSSSSLEPTSVVQHFSYPGCIRLDNAVQWREVLSYCMAIQRYQVKPSVGLREALFSTNPSGGIPTTILTTRVRAMRVFLPDICPRIQSSSSVLTQTACPS